MNQDLLLKYFAHHLELTPQEEKELLARFKFREYLKNQFVTKAGDINKHVNFVVKGCLKVFYLDDLGNEHIINFAVENWWTGDLKSFLTQTPAYYHVQCIEDSVLAHVSYDDMEELYVLVPKLERLFRIITQNAYVNSQKRITEYQRLTAKEKYQSFKNDYPQFVERVPQYLIASYLGMTPEFLSSVKRQIPGNQ